jgi:hypothetical protein
MRDARADRHDKGSTSVFVYCQVLGNQLLGQWPIPTDNTASQDLAVGAWCAGIRDGDVSLMARPFVRHLLLDCVDLCLDFSS